MGATNDDIKRRRSRIVPCRLNKHLAAPTVASRGETKMFWFCAALSAAGALELVICSFVLAVFFGYWLDRPALYLKVLQLGPDPRVHQLVLYLAPQAMRAGGYNDGAQVGI